MKTFIKFVYNLLFRSKKTYSQTGEDSIMDFYLRDVKNGFYVEVGTNHPVYLNNTYLFYRKGWRGLCIEPNASLCKFIKLIRRGDSVLNIGIGPTKREMDFYFFDPDTISTFSASEAEEYKKLGHKLVGSKKIPVMPLSETLEQYGEGRAVDILSVDTEGLDMEVLQSNNWEKFRPKVVVVEVVQYRKDRGERVDKQFDDFLESKGYRKFADTYINALYMDKAYAAKAGVVF